MRLTHPLQRLAGVYLRHFSLPRKERLFLASLGFFVAFVTVRAITYSIHDRVGPLHDVTVGGTHIHHLVWGILLLLVVGYLWLVQVGTGEGQTSRRASRLTALLYGTGAALTLDEFALWLNLQDVYWATEGRESIDAVVIFGTLLAVGRWGGSFLIESIRELWRLVRQ
ncbi:MAG TPA: hypothetical protein VM870_00020 [Pyrinomonadaceae bacterium]|jgi:hypothetical protein|nr:hypothetical protein [Pyrinomonadaceae bacterium]